MGRENVYFWVFQENREILDLLNVIQSDNVLPVRSKNFIVFVIDILRTLVTFEDLDAAALRRVAGAAVRQQLDAGSVVFEAGDESTQAYVILAGRVELRHENRVASVLVPGDIFGELSVLHGAPWPEAAVVTERSVVVAIPATAMLAEVRTASGSADSAEVMT